MILTDFFRALRQIDDPRFRRVMWVGIGLTIALLIGCYAALLAVFDYFGTGDLELPFVGRVGWLGDLLGIGSAVLMLILSMFLMIPVASAITSLFLDDVAQAVEDRHYPGLPDPPRVGYLTGIADTLAFGGLLVACNLGAFVLYAFFPLAAPLIFYAMNGFLLGREYFQIAAMRREGRDGARALRRAHLPQIWVAGILMALPLSIPVLNLVVPVLGAATFTHLYHRVSR